MTLLIADTCLAIWLLRDEPIAPSATEALNTAAAQQIPLFVSPISAWEIGLLVSRGRLNLSISPERWFTRLLGIPGVKLAEMPPHVLIGASFLPGTPPRDPADRVIAATARELGATLLTRDRLLLDYGRQGHVRVLSC